ncbi:MAG: hypothetical protein OXG05_07540 [Gammaproteobacteria bacterium]|nr:hypothetical protein [Gammaproteobacteria bacterium]
MNPEIVIAMYKPHEGKDIELRALIRKHVPTLRRLELITDRPALLAQAQNGTYLEIFEWREVGRVHEHPEVARIWEAMELVADLVSLSSLDEAKRSFPHFKPVELEGPA